MRPLGSMLAADASLAICAGEFSLDEAPCIGEERPRIVALGFLSMM